jgi:hexosaminidase
MKQHNISSVKELYAVYIRRATEIIFSLGCIPIVWEGFAEEYNDYISKDVIVVVWESLYQTADRLVKSGFKVINASWEPLYIVTRGRYWTPAEILKWNIRTWRNWLEKSAAYPNGITLAEDEGEVLGGQLCAWGNGFCNCDNCEALCEEELKLVEERIPAFAERTWNAYKR